MLNPLFSTFMRVLHLGGKHNSNIEMVDNHRIDYEKTFGKYYNHQIIRI